MKNFNGNIIHKIYDNPISVGILYMVTSTWFLQFVNFM